LVSLGDRQIPVGSSFYVTANYPLISGLSKEIGGTFAFDNSVASHMGNQGCKAEKLIQLQESMQGRKFLPK
jgi:hypothetical protein